METDFLNFHEEERYSLLETPYLDDMFDSKQLNGWDNEFELGFLSAENSDQDVKDVSPWKGFVDVEASDSKDSAADVQMTDNGLLSDMLDTLSYSNSNFDSHYLKYKVDLNTAITKSLLDKTNSPTSSNMYDIAENCELPMNNYEFDNVTDNFDLTEYVYGDVDGKPHVSPQKKMLKPMGKRMDFVEKHKNTFCNAVKSDESDEEDDDDDEDNVDDDDEEEDSCVDVETISENESSPVLEAKDLTSLLEKFEASESTLPLAPIKTENKDILQALPLELINRIKNSGKRKPIPLIPAIPTKRSLKYAMNQHKNKTTTVVKTTVQQIVDSHIQLDHDYCLSPTSQNDQFTNYNDMLCLKKDSGFVSEDIMTDDDSNGLNVAVQSPNRNTTLVNKQRPRIWVNKTLFPSVIKNQPTVKNADGKLMVSLLKANTIISEHNKLMAEEKNSEKRLKRKLNLAEYKKRRQNFGFYNSGNDSSMHSYSSSPVQECTKDLETRKLEHQEKLLRMATELLNTKSSSCVATNSPVSPAVQQCNSPKEQKATAESVEQTQHTSNEQPKPSAVSNDFEVKTLVSIGTNTLETSFQVKQKYKKKLNDIKPVLASAMAKINSNSLITSLIENIPKVTSNCLAEKQETVSYEEHGEDKTVIVLRKDRILASCRDVMVQTDFDKENNYKEKMDIDLPHSRVRRDSSCSSTGSSSSGRRSRHRTSNKSRRHSLNRQTRSPWSSGSSRMSYYSRSRSRSLSKYSESSRSSSMSRSRSNSPQRWHSTRSNSSQSRRSTSEYYRNKNRNSYTRHKTSSGKEDKEKDKERIREVDERRVIYVGRILEGTSKAELQRRFQRFGPINKISVHFRDHGDNYGFVTFAYKVDAYEAVEHGNDDPNEVKYDLSFGGRRAFCRTKYSDLDNIDDSDVGGCSSAFRPDNSFDILLREAQEKLLRNRKV